MDEVIMLLGEKPRELLEYALERGIVLNLCYNEQVRWRSVKAKIIKIYPTSFVLQIIRKSKAQPVVLTANHLVGISFQYDAAGGQDRFVFGTGVLSVKFDYEKTSEQGITLALPEEIEIVRRKNYLPVNVPGCLDVNVELWHRSTPVEDNGRAAAQVCHGFGAKLVSLAADCVSIAISMEQGPDFANGQYVGLRFAPMDNETPLSFNAYLRHVLPTWDAKDVVLELAMVGLEASPEGRMVLRRPDNPCFVYRYDVKSLSTGIFYQILPLASNPAILSAAVPRRKCVILVRYDDDTRPQAD